LTFQRPRRVTENDEFAAFARRVLRAWARRVAAGDIGAITDMAAAAREFDGAMREAVTGLRGKGYSWAEIAARLDVTRQAAQQRWGPRGPPPLAQPGRYRDAVQVAQPRRQAEDDNRLLPLRAGARDHRDHRDGPAAAGRQGARLDPGRCSG
jgi:hypothetical protein